MAMHFLILENKSVEINGVLFVGATLWTDFLGKDFYQVIRHYIVTVITTRFAMVRDESACNLRQLTTLCVSRFVVTIKSEIRT